METDIMKNKETNYFMNKNMLEYCSKVLNLKFYFDDLDKFKDNSASLIKYTEDEDILNNYDKFKWNLAFISVYTHDVIGIFDDDWTEIIVDYDSILSFLNLTSEQFDTIISTKRQFTEEDYDYIYDKLYNDYSFIFKNTSKIHFINNLSIAEGNEIFDKMITILYSDKIEKVANNIREGNNSTSNDRYFIIDDVLLIKNSMETYYADPAKKTRETDPMSVEDFDEQIKKLNNIYAMEKPSEELLNKLYSSIVLSDFIYTEDKRIASIHHTILKLTYLDAYKNGQTSINWKNYINALDQLSITKGKTKKLIFN